MSSVPVDHGAYNEPGKASVEDGLVVLDGPDATAITMTAFAASETGRRLIEAAKLAQQHLQIGD